MLLKVTCTGRITKLSLKPLILISGKNTVHKLTALLIALPHTQLPIFQSQNTRDWEEADITVIKKQPLSPPTLTLLDTFRPGVNSTFYFDANFSYEDPNNAGSYIPIPPRTTFTITTVSDISGFKVGDNIEALYRRGNCAGRSTRRRS